MGQNYKCTKCGMAWEETTDILNKVWCPRCRSVTLVATHVSADIILPEGLSLPNSDEAIPAEPMSQDDFKKAIASIPDKRSEAEKAKDDYQEMFVTKKDPGGTGPLKAVPIKVPGKDSTPEQVAIFKELLAGVLATAFADIEESLRIMPLCEEVEQAKLNLEACAGLITIIMDQDWQGKEKSLIYN